MQIALLHPPYSGCYQVSTCFFPWISFKDPNGIASHLMYVTLRNSTCLPLGWGGWKILIISYQHFSHYLCLLSFNSINFNSLSTLYLPLATSPISPWFFFYNCNFLPEHFTWFHFPLIFPVMLLNLYFVIKSLCFFPLPHYNFCSGICWKDFINPFPSPSFGWTLLKVSQIWPAFCVSWLQSIGDPDFCITDLFVVIISKGPIGVLALGTISLTFSLI